MADFNNAPNNDFSQEDIDKNKVFAILAYFGFLVLIPIFAAKDSKFARFHANQGLVICLFEIVVSIAANFLGILSILNIASAVFAIMGIIYAAQGQAKELPLIGSIHILS